MRGLALPLQVVEEIGVARSAIGTFDEVATGDDDGWRNRLIWGDNAHVLASLADELAGKVVLEVEMAVLDDADLVRAAALAGRHSLRMFDAVGAALALDRGLPLLTGDARSARALTGVVEVEVLSGI